VHEALLPGIQCMQFLQTKLQQAFYNGIALLLGITVSILVVYASSPATA
jgi:hypothetical protein